MTADERLLYETRVRTRQVVIAGLAAVFLLVAAIIGLAGPHAKVSELTLDLITAHKRFPLDVIAAVINALGSLALVGTLVFLFGAARARNPQAQPFIRIITIVGGVAAAVTGVGYAIVIAIKSNQFVTTGSQTYPQAHSLTSGAGVVALQLVGQASALLLAVAFVLVSLNAMRVGLLTRFMGYLGIFAGILVLFQITQVPIIQAYWLAALGYLISGRWPTGVPPAWRSGQAEPWPSSQALRERRAAAGAARRTRGGRGLPQPEPQPAPAAETVGAPAPRSTRAGTSKRKRKRRK